MRTNITPRTPKRGSNTAARTHEGAVASVISPEMELRRSVLSCLLWEDTFYESGQSIADRIVTLASQIERDTVAALAIEARTVHGLRHVPLLLLLDLIRRGGAGTARIVADTLARPDEIGELISLYWQRVGGRALLPRQLRMGIGMALERFDAYQLAKWNKDGAVKIRDAVFMAHPKPSEALGGLLAKLVNKSFVPEKTKAGFPVKETYGEEIGLPIPETWEVQLSAGKDKRETFTSLLNEGKLGYLALLRNLRNMSEAGVDTALVENAIMARKGARWVLPFRYVAAVRAAPAFEKAIDYALKAAVADSIPMTGLTLVVVDVSQSMEAPISKKSDLKRIDAAAALAVMINGQKRTFSFSNALHEVTGKVDGMSGVKRIIDSQAHSGTELLAAIAGVDRAVPKYDRMIVITDEQATGMSRYGVNSLITPKGRGYVINVASFEHGVGYGEKWVHIDGFSEACLKYILAAEALALDAPNLNFSDLTPT